MARTLIQGGYVVTLNPARETFEGGSLVSEGERITYVGKEEPKGGFDEVIDARGMIVLPGLINMHQHHWYNLLKGLGDGLTLDEWFTHLAVPAFQHLTDEDLRASMYLGCLEMIGTGTTCCLSHVVTRTDEASIRAYAEPAIELGFRQVIAKEARHTPQKLLFSDPTLPVGHSHNLEEELAQVEEIVRRWDRAGGGLIRMALAIETSAHWLAVGATSVELIQRGADLADRLGLKIADHADGGMVFPEGRYQRLRRERGMSDTEFLVRLGVLDKKWILKHHLWVEDREIRMMAETGASGVATPISEALRGGGASPVPRMLKAGVNVALGTDGPMIDNSVDMVEVMKFASVLHNGRHYDPRALPAEKVLEMATLNAAKALGLEGELGSLEVGKKADVVVFDLNRPHVAVANRPVANFVFSCKGTDVDTVLINGRAVLKGGRMVAFDGEREVLREARRRAESLIERAHLSPLAKRPWPP